MRVEIRAPPGERPAFTPREPRPAGDRPPRRPAVRQPPKKPSTTGFLLGRLTRRRARWTTTASSSSATSPGLWTALTWRTSSRSLAPSSPPRCAHPPQTTDRPGSPSPSPGHHRPRDRPLPRLRLRGHAEQGGVGGSCPRACGRQHRRPQDCGRVLQREGQGGVRWAAGLGVGFLGTTWVGTLFADLCVIFCCLSTCDSDDSAGK